MALWEGDMLSHDRHQLVSKCMISIACGLQAVCGEGMR